MSVTPAAPPAKPEIAWLTPQSADTLSGLNTFLKEIREALAPFGLAGIVVRRTDPGALRRAARADVWVINSYHPGWHMLGRLLGKKVITAAHFPFWCREKGESGNSWGKNLVREFFWRWECPCGDENRLCHFAVNMAGAMGRVASLLLAHGVVAPSQSLARHLGVPASVIHYPLAAPQRGGRRPQSRTKDLVLACRLEDQKGVRDAVGAMALLPPGAGRFRLHIFGGGPLARWVKEQEKKSGGRILFHGVVERDTVRQTMASAFCLLMPSRFLEPAGFSALEAIAEGTPVVFYADGGLPEMVGRGGVVAHEKSPQGLAAAVLRLARRPSLWKQCSQEGPRQVRAEFSPRLAANRWRPILTQGAGGGSGGRVRRQVSSKKSGFGNFTSRRFRE